MPTQALENSKQNQVSGTESSWPVYVNVKYDNNDVKAWDCRLLTLVSFSALPGSSS